MEKAASEVAEHVSRRAFWATIVFGYGLAYGTLLLMAVRKGLDVTDAYTLVVWLVSALALASVSAVIAAILTALIGRFTFRAKTFLIAWCSILLVLGGALVVSAN